MCRQRSHDDVLIVSNQPHHAAATHNPVRLLAGTCELAASALSTLVTGLMLLGATAFLAGAYAIVSMHVATQTVLTGSMRGTFDPGALVFTRPMPVSAVRPGDVIVFTPPGHDAPYTHRVVTVTRHNGQPVVTTKGDANPAPDAWKAELGGSTVPRVFGHVPYVGGALLHIRSQGLHTALLALLGLVIAVSGTRVILGSPRQRTPPPPALTRPA